ncbi:MAG: lipid IV(A) 3-deoxy-D-manno-octulosonic acid transferase [Sideroxydans sp.]|nr:lipid IV(A) 3-deoxy-D-manno-octulosonic acid transferase [Sideroxydans sp.]
MRPIKPIAARFFYTLLLCLLFPFIFFKLLWRARLQPEYLQHIAERFGFYNTLSPTLSRKTGEGANESLREFSNPAIIWLHAVSVGETRATVSLVEQLCRDYPHHQILLTHTTPTGRATSEQLYGERVLRVYLPYDYPFAVQRFLRHFQPQLGMLMETEIWFNLIHACEKNHVPLLLLNARMSEKSARGYGRFATLTHHALRALSGIAAQTETDAQRLAALGGMNISLMGNLKFDIVPPKEMLALGKVLREQFGATRKVFLAASTREGEEELLLHAWQAASPQALLVLVPRHPQRFDAVAELIKKRGLKLQRRSENKTVSPDTQVLLGDSMGEMFAYYAAVDVAFIGGSLLPFGGQNLIEACAVGTPVLIGNHTFNFADATRLAIDAGAAQRVSDADELVQVVTNLFGNANTLSVMRTAGLRFVASHQGATNKAMQLIERHLPSV